VRAPQAFPDRFRAYLAVSPHYPELLSRELAEYDSRSDVFVGLKLLPGYHKVRLSDERYRRAFESANERGLMLLAHTYDGSQ
jgi:predicted TIM-barrel fold metal-dependent hydrolase